MELPDQRTDQPTDERTDPLPAAVIFDVDGTLVDSERHGHRVAFNQAFAEFDLPDRWDEAYYGELLAVAGGRQRLFSYLTDQGYDRGQAEELAGQLHARKTARFTAMAADGEIPARPGVNRLLDELEAAGITLGIATTGSRTWVEPLLDRLFGLGRFATVLTGDEVPRRKPAADVYSVALEQLGVPPDRAVAVEDSAKGLTAARGAGLACLVVVNGYTREELTGHPAVEGQTGAVLVVDRLGGPGAARVLAGSSDLLDDGVVTPVTLGRLAGRGRVAHE